MKKIDDTLEAQDAFFGTYVRLHVAIQDLIADGKGDSEDADLLREDMEVVWDQMSNATQHLTRNVASRLGVFTLVLQCIQAHAWSFGDLWSGGSKSKPHKRPHKTDPES